MDFKMTNEKSVLAFLTKDDMTAYGLTYEELDYCNEKSRVVLKEILSAAKTETAFENCSRLRIDVMPGESDGCMILFTDLEESESKNRTQEKNLFESESFDDILDCAATLGMLEMTAPESALFGDENGCRLIVRGANERVLSLIGEYLSLCISDETEIARTKETMKCLIEKNALEILCGKISES